MQERKPVENPVAEGISADPMAGEKLRAAARRSPEKATAIRDLVISASKPAPIVNDLIYFKVGSNFPAGYRGAVVDSAGQRAMHRSGWVEFAVEDGAGNPVFSGPGEDGQVGVQLDKPGMYSVFAQVHEGHGISANEYPVQPRRIWVYPNENAIRDELLARYSVAIPIAELRARLDPLQLANDVWAQFAPVPVEPTPRSTSPWGGPTAEQQSRIDHIAVKLARSFEIQTDVALPAMLEFSKDTAPVRFSLAPAHNFRNPYTARKPSYHWYALVHNPGHRNARTLGKEFGQFAGQRAINLNEEARNAGVPETITDPSTAVPVRFQLPDIYRIICFEYEDGRPQYGPASKDDTSNRWIYRVMHHAPVTVLDAKAYAEAQQAPEKDQERRERAAESRSQYLDRVSELSDRFLGTPTPLRAIHIENKTGVVTRLLLYFGIDKSNPNNYLLVDLTRHLDSQGNDNPHVSRTFNGSPHAAIQELANFCDYPEGVIQVSLPGQVNGSRLGAFNAHSIPTQGAPWAKRLGMAILPGWSVGLGLAGGSVSLWLLRTTRVIGPAAAAFGGGALGAIGVPVLAAGVLGFGLLAINDGIKDVKNLTAIALDVGNLAACLLGVAVMPGAFSRVALTRVGGAEGASAGGPASSFPASATAGSIGANQELLFWANATNLGAAAADSGVLIAPQIVEQIQALSQSGLSEAEKQAATQSLITSGVALGLIILVGPRQNYAEARAVITQRLGKIAGWAKGARGRRSREDEIWAQLPAMAGGSPLNFEDLIPFRGLQDGPHKEQLRKVLASMDPALTERDIAAINETFHRMEAWGASADNDFLINHLTSIQTSRTQRHLRLMGMATIDSIDPLSRIVPLWARDFELTTHLLAVAPKHSFAFTQLVQQLHALRSSGDALEQKLRLYLQARLDSVGNDVAKRDGLRADVELIQTLLGTISDVEVYRNLWAVTAEAAKALRSPLDQRTHHGSSVAIPPARPPETPSAQGKFEPQIGRPDSRSNRAAKDPDFGQRRERIGPSSPILYHDGSLAQLGHVVSRRDSTWVDTLFDRPLGSTQSPWRYLQDSGGVQFQFAHEQEGLVFLRSLDGNRWIVVGRNEFTAQFGLVARPEGSPLGGRPSPTVPPVVAMHPPSLLDILPILGEEIIAPLPGRTLGSIHYPGWVYRVEGYEGVNYRLRSLTDVADQRTVSIEELQRFLRWQPPRHLQHHGNGEFNAEDLHHIYHQVMAENHNRFLLDTKKSLSNLAISQADLENLLEEVRRRIAASEARWKYRARDPDQSLEEMERREQLVELRDALEVRSHRHQPPVEAEPPFEAAPPVVDLSPVEWMLSAIRDAYHGYASADDLGNLLQAMREQKQGMAARGYRYANGVPSEVFQVNYVLGIVDQELAKLANKIHYLKTRKPLTAAQVKDAAGKPLTAFVRGEELPVDQRAITDGKVHLLVGGNPYRFEEVQPVYEDWVPPPPILAP